MNAGLAGCCVMGGRSGCHLLFRVDWKTQIGQARPLVITGFCSRECSPTSCLGMNYSQSLALIVFLKLEKRNSCVSDLSLSVCVLSSRKDRSAGLCLTPWVPLWWNGKVRGLHCVFRLYRPCLGSSSGELPTPPPPVEGSLLCPWFDHLNAE